MDPIEQAHIGHRQGQIRRMMNDARLSRDPIPRKSNYPPTADDARAVESADGCNETNDVYHGYYYRGIFLVNYDGRNIQSRLCFSTLGFRVELAIWQIFVLPSLDMCIYMHERPIR